MTRAEREMVHDAIAEAVVHYDSNPSSDAARNQLIGMRYVAGLLGMAEGRTEYDWAGSGSEPAQRRVRRLLLIRGRRDR